MKLTFQQRSPTAPVQARLANLLPAMERLPAVMRQGPGSVADQFSQQATQSPNGRVQAWPPRVPFGTAKGGPLLVRSGQYAAAWTGQGAGSLQLVTPTSCSIGVSPAAFPQAAVFQASGPTAITVTRKMRMYLGMTYGVWLRGDTMALTVPPRPVRSNPIMTRRCRQVLINYIVNGRAEEYAAS